MARAPATAEGWMAIAFRHPPVLPGGPPLAEAGAAPACLYTVRAGCIKSYTLDADGTERIRGFYFPGDLVGVETFGQQHASSGVTAVTASQVCAAPMADVQSRVATDASFSNRLLEQARRELTMALSLSGEFSADRRVAAFLLHLNHRIGNGNVIRLPMTRREIGGYLRLATETVCRVLARFEEKGWLSSRDKRIELLDVDALTELAGPVGLAESAG